MSKINMRLSTCLLCDQSKKNHLIYSQDIPAGFGGAKLTTRMPMVITIIMNIQEIRAIIVVFGINQTQYFLTKNIDARLAVQEEHIQIPDKHACR